ncbi:hypothetical protein B0H14DRAFT_2587275 [Mycena olivaceomarginata]|nr:hypothetical protein B0H14DRAFT_2587275 [Mycena olivaceomarginata]
MRLLVSCICATAGKEGLVRGEAEFEAAWVVYTEQGVEEVSIQMRWKSREGGRRTGGMGNGGKHILHPILGLKPARYDALEVLVHVTLSEPEAGVGSGSEQQLELETELQSPNRISKAPVFELRDTTPQRVTSARKSDPARRSMLKFKLSSPDVARLNPEHKECRLSP